MSEFQEMIREAFLGEEAFEPAPGEDALRESIAKFHRRDRTLRIMAWLMVSAMSAVAIWGVWGFFGGAEEAGQKELILYATAFLWGSTGISFGKMFLFTQQESLRVKLEIKRMHLALLRGTGEGRAE